MSSLTKISDVDAKLKSEKGAILFIVAACLVVLLGFMGLAIDLGHAYNNKSLLQNMADACALAGGSALNGKPEGIDLATSRARDEFNRLSNRTEFNNTNVTIPVGNISFAANLAGPWTLTRNDSATIKYVRVIVPPQDTEVVFAKVIPGIPAVMSFGAEAVAGQIPQDEVCTNLDPFSPVAIDAGDPNFGYVVGQRYALRNDPNGEGAPAADGNPKPGQLDGDCGSTPGNGHLGQCSACNGKKDDVDDPCDGYGGQTGNFGLSDPTKSGPSTRCFKDIVINGTQKTCIKVGAGTLPTDTGNGGINVEKALQERYCQDTVSAEKIPYDDGSVNSYVFLKGSNKDYRRVIRVAFNDGVPAGHSSYNVLGFGCFFMSKCPNIKQGSAAVCLEYIGACKDNGEAVPEDVGPSITKLVLFK